MQRDAGLCTGRVQEWGPLGVGTPHIPKVQAEASSLICFAGPTLLCPALAESQACVIDGLSK